MEKYVPLIGCDKCKIPTRHLFLKTEKRTFQCIEERRGLSASEKKRLEEESVMWALLHKCVRCGTVRGYGNIDKHPLEYIF